MKNNYQNEEPLNETNVLFEIENRDLIISIISGICKFMNCKPNLKNFSNLYNEFKLTISSKHYLDISFSFEKIIY